MWKFKSLKGKDKWIFLLTVGVILCILAFPVENLTGRREDKAAEKRIASKTEESAIKNTASNSDEWISAGGASQDRDAEGEPAAAALAKADNSYEAQLEQRIRDLLKHVDGVGNVDVMVVLKSSAEKVIHVDDSTSYSSTEETDSSGGSRKIESQDRDSSTVMSSQNGQSLPIIEKEICPEVAGIIISASGGGNPGVQAEITAAMEALFGLPAHKIKVLKRVE